MEICSFRKKHKVQFSECDYWGEVKIESYLCWFEDGRFDIGRESGLNAFFYKEHQGADVIDSTLNKSDKRYEMPVIQSKLNFKEKLKLGSEVYIYTWLEQPIGVSCIFHNRVVSLDLNTIYAEAEIMIGLIDEKKGLITELPSEINSLIVSYIKNLKEDENHVLLEE